MTTITDPQLIYSWASQSSAVTSTPTPAVQAGDLCVVWKAGAPSDVGTGVPTSFLTADTGTSFNGTSKKASVFYHVLTSSDISGGNLIAVSLNTGGTTTLRIGMEIWRDANGFDESTCLLYHNAFNTNTAAPAVVATITNAARRIVAVSVNASAGNNSQQFTFAGAPTGNTAARDPYHDESASTTTIGAHTSRTDGTGTVVTSGSPTVSWPSVVASDLFSQVSGTGIPANAYITAVDPGVGFTMSANATSSGSGVTLTITPSHYGTNTNIMQSDWQWFDVGDTPGNVTVAVGTATNVHVTITAAFQANSSDRAFTLTDNLGLTDAETSASAFIRSYTDNEGLTDSSSAHLNGDTLTALFNDTLGISDVVPRALTATITDHLGATDAGTTVISQPERINFTDNQTLGIGRARIITDTLGIPDVLSPVTSTGSHTFTDRIGLTDNLTTSAGLHFTATITDNLGMLDSVGPSIFFDDPFGLTDFVIVNAPGAQRYFRPPTEDIVPSTAYDVPPIWNRLMRYWPNRPRGVAIWKLPDGTYTINQPYPTILDDQQNRDTLFPRTPTPSSGLGTSTSNLVEVTYELVYLGGHVYPISEEEADALTAAGFGAGVSTDPP